ncbi:hypothetical protein GCM10023148_18280 [Actinokineospora soli]
MAGPGDVKVSDRPYVRYDGGSDPVTADCGTNNRQQNEPAAAVAPHNPSLLTAGSNDYCTVGVAGGTWAGFYYSADAGTTWTNSLLPGYPGDDSNAGLGSPLRRMGMTNAGDPVQAWDNDGHLYYGGIAFNRQRPATGSIWVARYTWTGGPAPTYDRTTLVARGTPSPIFLGLFHDKVQLEVDRGADSPHAGNVYVCWARFTASGPNNGVFLSRSTDGGLNYSNPTKISDGVHGSQFCDIAVTRNGHVYVAWRQYESIDGQANAAVFAKSTDGGAKFSKPAEVARFSGWDPTDRTVNAAAYGQAKYDACLAADSTPGTCASPEPRATARDCGDGPLACRSGYVFFRASSQVRVAADPTAAGNPNQVYVTFDATVPGSEVPTGTTYGTVVSGVGSQAAVYLTSTATGGATWSAPARVDAQAKGHQLFPDIHADAGRLHAVWQDSRADTATGLTGDWRTVPISNRAVAADPPGAVNAGPGLDTYYATSGDSGATWTVVKVSTTPTMPQYEQFGDRDTVFFGDYNSIAAAGPTAFMTWTDQRDTVPGTDPRHPVDGADGFDVLQCRALLPDGTYGPDTCPTAGGLDQNIYGKVVP